MRAHFLQALAQPLEDIDVAYQKLEPFRRSVAAACAVEAKVDMAARALETLSLGLALAELYVEAGEKEDEP